jgi:hypothetical protein
MNWSPIKSSAERGALHRKVYDIRNKWPSGHASSSLQEATSMSGGVKVLSPDGKVQVIFEANGRLLIKHNGTYLDITAHTPPLIRIHGPRRMSLRNESEDGNSFIKSMFR